MNERIADFSRIWKLFTAASAANAAGLISYSCYLYAKIDASFLILFTGKTMKHHFTNRLFLLLALALFAVSAAAQTDPAFQKKLDDIDSYAQKVMADWPQPGMAIAVVKDDKVVFKKGYGVREIGRPEKVDADTVFAIASNSKAFLAATVAILVDEGKLKWDDKVTKYLPDFKMYDPYVTNELTIRDLLTHRNGLATFSGDLLWYENTYSPDEIVARVRYLKPVAGFRTQFGYQNVMFVTAGQVVEKVTGKTWPQFVKERILKPLKMERTTTSVKDLPNNAAVPHNESFGGKLRPLHHGNVDGGVAAAGLNSSVADLSQWIRLQLGRGTIDGNKLISSARITEMWQPYMMMPISEAAERSNPTRHFSGVGMGWFVNDYHGRKIINHSGGLDGMLSYTVLIPEENLGFVVLTNSEYPPFSIMMNKMMDVFVNAPERDLNGNALRSAAAQKAKAAEDLKKIEDARRKDTRPSLSLDDYAGRYSDDYYGTVSVVNEGGKLVFKMDASPNLTADLEHWHFDTFRLRWRASTAYNFSVPGFITFDIDKTPAVRGMTIDQPNNDFWFYEMSPKKVR